MTLTLNEQHYKNPARCYWHGSRTGETELHLSSTFCSHGVLFLTTSARYALKYAEYDGRLDATVFKVYLKTPLEIFNARSKVDAHRLKTLLQLSHDEITLLQNIDWTTTFVQRRKIIDAIHDLKYDGFFNYERSSILARDANPSVGIFDLDKVTIDRVYTAKELSAVDHNVEHDIDAEVVLEKVRDTNAKTWRDEPEARDGILREVRARYEDEDRVKEFLTYYGYLRYAD